MKTWLIAAFVFATPAFADSTLQALNCTGTDGDSSYTVIVQNSTGMVVKTSGGFERPTVETSPVRVGKIASDAKGATTVEMTFVTPATRSMGLGLNYLVTLSNGPAAQLATRANISSGDWTPVDVPLQCWVQMQNQ